LNSLAIVWFASERRFNPHAQRLRRFLAIYNFAVLLDYGETTGSKHRKPALIVATIDFRRVATKEYSLCSFTMALIKRALHTITRQAAALTPSTKDVTQEN
jgi:hypothetical protein